MKIRPEPNPEWLEEFTELSNDPYVASKLRRNDRIRELMSFINYYLPELKGEDKDISHLTDEELANLEITKSERLVVDIGVGFCEFLDIARSYGCNIQGIDAPLEKDGMGSKYQRATQLMAERQEIPVIYEGFENLVEKRLPFIDNTVDIIHSCGSLDFVLRPYCEGTPGMEFENDSKRLSYVFNGKGQTFLITMFEEIHRVLKNNGIFIFYMNTLGNQKEFSEYLQTIVAQFIPKMELVQSDLFRIFKFKKVV